MFLKMYVLVKNQWANGDMSPTDKLRKSESIEG